MCWERWCSCNSNFTVVTKDPPQDMVFIESFSSPVEGSPSTPPSRTAFVPESVNALVSCLISEWTDRLSSHRFSPWVCLLFDFIRSEYGTKPKKKKKKLVFGHNGLTSMPAKFDVCQFRDKGMKFFKGKKDNLREKHGFSRYGKTCLGVHNAYVVRDLMTELWSWITYGVDTPQPHLQGCRSYLHVCSHIHTIHFHILKTHNNRASVLVRPCTYMILTPYFSKLSF